MLNVSEAIKQAYINGNPHAETFITVGNVNYGPTNILAGSVSVVESICSAEQFTLNRVEKNSITFTLFNITEGISDLQGKSVSAKQRVTVNNISTDIPLGEFTVVDAVNDGDYLIKCTAYDSATLAMDASADAWWNTEVTFPITIRQLLLALLNKIDVSHNIPLTFTNYDFTITQRPVFVEGTTYADIVGYIQEVIGGFLKPNRYGVIQLYRRIIAEGFYPKNGRYPSDTLYPKRSTTVNTFADEDTVGEQVVNYGQIVSGLTIADFTTQTVERVQVRGTADDIGIIVGQGTNTYVIEANPLLYGLSDATGRPIVQNIYNEIIGLTYIPFKGRFMGLPFMEAGDMVIITTYNDLHVESPVFKRTLCGSRLAFDELETNGVEELEQVEEVNRTITVLRQKTHEVENTVDGLRSTVTEVVTDVSDLETDVSGLSATVTTHTSEISQNADAITHKVSTTDYNGTTIVSLINQTAEAASISATKINLSGYVTISSLQSKQSSTFIDGGNIKTNSLSASTIKGGTLKLGGYNNENGVLQILNANGNEVGRWDKNGITVTSGTISGSTITVGGNNNTNGQIYVRNASNQNIVILNKDGVTVQNGGQISGAIVVWNKGTNDQATIAGAKTAGGTVANGIVATTKAMQINGDFCVAPSNSLLFKVTVAESLMQASTSNNRVVVDSSGAKLSSLYGSAIIKGKATYLEGTSSVISTVSTCKIEQYSNEIHLHVNNSYGYTGRIGIKPADGNNYGKAYMNAYHSSSGHVNSYYAGITCAASSAGGGLFISAQKDGSAWDYSGDWRVSWMLVNTPSGTRYALCKAD